MQVVGLYTKAKSPLHTAAFHEVAAQADMDENQDYVRAESSLQVQRKPSSCYTFNSRALSACEIVVCL